MPIAVEEFRLITPELATAIIFCPTFYMTNNNLIKLIMLKLLELIISWLLGPINKNGYRSRHSMISTTLKIPKLMITWTGKRKWMLKFLQGKTLGAKYNTKEINLKRMRQSIRSVFLIKWKRRTEYNDLVDTSSTLRNSIILTQLILRTSTCRGNTMLEEDMKKRN